jgi:hypothetical protein
MRKTLRFVLSLFVVAALIGCASTKTQTYPAFSGSVTAIEKYGHAVTTIKAQDLFDAGYALGDVLTVTYDNGYTFDAPLVAKYEVDKGQPLVRTEYADGFVACCINYGKMNQVAGIDVGSKVTITMKEPKAYLTEYEIRSLASTNVRGDYSTDEEFANYRMMTGGALKQGILYRGSHPTKKGWSRAPYVSALMEKDGIESIINMSDTETELSGYLDPSNPDASMYYQRLHDEGNVIALSMSMTFTDETFGKNIAQACRFIINHDGPFFVHCNEGKDRTGFFGMFIEALMGATEKEITEDYMQSYVNFYHVEKGSEKYEAIAKGNCDPMLSFIKGTAPNLSEGARQYAASIGLSQEEIRSLLVKLGK